jgi:murein DD-endopeptidase MepM/ murein hydrolase activator NlpD
MKFYRPIDGLLDRRRRVRRGRYTFGLLGILGLAVAAYLVIGAYKDGLAEARTDRIIALSSPDFTDVWGDTPDLAAVEAEEAAALERLAPRIRRNRAEGAIRANQTLFVAMRDAGVDSASIQAVVDSLTPHFDFRHSRPGDRWEVRVDNDGVILSFRYHRSAEEIYEAYRRSDGSYDAGRVDVPLEVVTEGYGDTVTTSVYHALQRAGEDTSLATRFMEIFRWDFDFSRDARPGDTFRVLVEKIYLDGQFLRYGRVLAAEYAGRSGTLRAFSFAAEEGRSEYYTADGEPLRRMFLQAPLEYRRISSTFTRRRFHPILRRYRPHLGVDYAAATGTPVWAIADGSITFAGQRGANGNLVVIEHDEHYDSRYAHLSRFAPGIRRSREVSQGEVIGYVGNTGMSTGPHLHFGVRLDGEYIDPLSIQSSRGARLEGDTLEAFLAEAARLGQALDSIPLAPVDVSYPMEDADEPAEDASQLPNDFDIVDDSGEEEPE